MKLHRYFVALFLAALSVLDSKATIDATLQMQLGNPTGASADATNHQHYLIQRPQYSLDYNDTTQEPNWVSWDLTTGDVGGSGRSNAFSPDTGLPAGFYEVTTGDYNGVGSMTPEFNRGHMCPSDDRTDTTADNIQVFLMTNIVPQSADNNQGPWELFENYCRTQAAAGNEVLIISGPSVFNGPYSFVNASYRLPSGKVAIPSYTWKIAVFVPLGSGTALSRITASTPVIAIKIPNLGGIISDPWQKYVTSVAQIQADTGFTFFSALDPSIAAAFDSEVYGQSTGTPTITTQPAPQTSAVGGTATFTVAATGNATLVYQWSKDGAPLSDATADTLNLSNIQVSDGGNYTVTITNSVGTITSNPAALSISGLPPSIAVQPTSRTVAAGAETVFTVTATGSPNLTYQWYLGSNALTDVGTHFGSTTATLTLIDPQASDAGSYSVIVTNSVNTATSTPATLGVTPAGPTITTQPSGQSANVGGSATFTVAAAGSEPLTYQWFVGSTPITGAVGPSLALNNVQTTDAGSYSVTVTNGISSAPSTPASLTVNTASTGTLDWDFTVATPVSGLPSDITGGTVTQVNNFGTTALLTTTSASSGYAGASGTSNAGLAVNKGTFNASTNAYFQFTLTPVTGKQLSATSISFGERSTSTGPTAYSVFTSVDNYVTAVASGTINNNSTWVLFTPTFTPVTGSSGAPITFRLYFYGYTGASNPASGTANCRIDDLKLGVSTIVAPLVPVTPTVSSTTPASTATNVDVTAPISITFNEPVTVSGSWASVSSGTQGGIPATISGGPTTFTVTPVTSLPASDTITVFITGAQVLDQATGTLTLASDYSFTFTTASPAPPQITTQPTPQTVPAGSNVTFTVAASGPSPITYQWRKGGTPILAATGISLSLTNVQAGDAANYDVLVTNPVGTTPSSAAALVVTPAAPTITTPPSAQTVVVGQAVQLSVAASVTTPFSYQWYLGVTPIPNATDPTYSIASVQSSDAGSYTVVVSNGVAPDAPSSAATLTVNPVSSGTLLWNFTAGANPASAVPGDLAVSALSQGNNNGTTALVTSTSASSGYTGASGGNNAGAAARIGALSTASGGSAYFEFTLTPVAGKAVTVSGISFGSRSTSTGPQAYTLLSSADGFVHPLVTGAFLANSVWTLYAPALSPISSAPGTPITFRLYGSNGAGNAAASTANWRIDDLQVTFFTREAAAVTLGGLSFTYDGNPKPVTATTSPSNLAVTYTFNGSSLVPTQAGNYTVIATINDPIFGGSATGTLVIAQSPATVTFGATGQAQTVAYDGTPKNATATTTPAGLALSYTYNGSATPPTTPGTYAVVATITDPNYSGNASGTLVIVSTVLVLHAPTVTGGVDGSVQVLTGENITIGGSGYISGDLLVPGTPTVTVSGTATYGGTIDGTGSTSPTGYVVALNNNALLRHVVRRTDPIAIPTVSAPPAPTGTRTVSLTSASQSAGDFSTILNLTLAANAGPVAVPPGTYGNFSAAGNSALVLGVPGATTPAIYNLQSLTVNLLLGNAQLQIVGPVILTVANGTILSGTAGSAANPGWLTLRVANGGVTSSGNITIKGSITAPNGTVTLNGNATLNGTVVAQHLTLNGTSLINDPNH